MWMTLLNRLTRDRNVLRRYVRREPFTKGDLALSAALALMLLPPAILLELGAVATGRGGALAVIGRAP